MHILRKKENPNPLIIKGHNPEYSGSQRYTKEPRRSLKTSPN